MRSRRVYFQGKDLISVLHSRLSDKLANTPSPDFMTVIKKRQLAETIAFTSHTSQAQTLKAVIRSIHAQTAAQRKLQSV